MCLQIEKTITDIICLNGRISRRIYMNNCEQWLSSGDGTYYFLLYTLLSSFESLQLACISFIIQKHKKGIPTLNKAK